MVYRFLEKEERPKPTIAMDYSFGRKTVKSLVSDIRSSLIDRDIFIDNRVHVLAQRLTRNFDMKPTCSRGLSKWSSDNHRDI